MPESNRPDTAVQVRDVAIATFAVVATAGVLFWLVGPVIDVLLIAFAGLLLGLFLRGLGHWIAERTQLPAKWAVSAVCLVLVALGAAAVWLAAPEVGRQADELSQTLPKAVERLGATLEREVWGRQLLSRVRDLGGDLSRREAVSRAGGLLSGTVGAFASYIVFVFVGLFIAFDPESYRAGVLKLAPPSRRARLGEVLDSTGHALRQWMLGKVFAMAVVGALTWLGLLLLGIPLGLTLALFAALLTFIPNLGPVLSAVPAVLLGLMDRPAKAAYVVALYITIQTLESYVLTPIVQKKTISLPPALTILAQVVMGTLTGGLGIVVATPLLAATSVIVKKLYVEDMLGDHRPSEDVPE